MNLVEWLLRLMVGFGAEWVMWLLVGLSVVSVAIMLERSWFYWTLRDDIGKLAAELRAELRAGDLDGARKRLERSSSAEAVVALAGLAVADGGPRAAEEAMRGAASLQRLKLERRIAFLGTLGNIAPFIGLFGTVIGIVGAFEALGTQSNVAATAAVGAPTQVMTALAEALVATAVGLGVAIPAVVTFNYFQRHIRAILANTDALCRLVLSHLLAQDGEPPPEEATP